MTTTHPIPASPEFRSDLLALCDNGVKTHRLTRTARQQIAALLDGVELVAAVASEPANQWLTTGEVAAMMQLTTTRVTQLRAKSAIIGTGIGRGTRYKRSEIETYMANRPTKAATQEIGR